MALPSTGPISMSQVRSELNLSGAISLGQAQVRNLAGRPSGQVSMSDLRGKSNINVALTFQQSVTGFAASPQSGGITFEGASGNNVVVRANGAATNTTVWNLGNSPRSLFQVMATHTSGTAPTGSTGTWLEMTGNNGWNWSQSFPGSRSGGINIQVRLKSTGAILASRTFSVSLEYFDF